MKIEQQPNRIWRWLATVSVLLNVAGSNWPDRFMPGQSIAAVTHKYHSLFTPAEYVLIIWGFISASFIIYAIYQLLPSQRSAMVFDRLAKPFILSNLLGITWMIAYRLDFMMLSFALITVMLALSAILYFTVRNVVLRHDYSNWISIPFSLFTAWLSVVTLANATILIDSQEWYGNQSIQIAITMAMILAACALGIFVSYRCADVVFPAVITWTCVAIFIEQSTNHFAIGIVALLCAALPIGWFLLTVIKRVAYRHRVWANKFSFSETMRLKLNSQNKLVFGGL